MGTLIGKAYPIEMALGLADHTYVECGTGRVGWSCWGGKNGGNEITRGTGYTTQANAIANPNERAGITCYGVNGVCHQAANRILWPARVLVSSARGYWVSSSLYGTYGRLNPNILHICEAPFDQHNADTGDLPECVDTVPPAPSELFFSNKHVALMDAHFKAEKNFAESAMAVHTKLSTLAAEDTQEHLNAHVEHFILQSQYRLGSLYNDALQQTLTNLHTDIERQRLKLDQALANNDIDLEQFTDEFNQLTIKFQDLMAETLKPEQYRAYFNLEHSTRIILLDPKIINAIHAQK